MTRSLSLPILLLLISLFQIIPALYQPFSLGSFNGTVLTDGVYTFCQNPYKIDDKIFERVIQYSRGGVFPHTLAENVAVIDINGVRVMVDTGTFLPPELQVAGTRDGGKLLQSMRQAGIAPESIDAVLLTHGHLDHALGLVSPQNTATFPNAVVYISKIDHEFWSNPTNDTELRDPASLQGARQAYLRSIAPYPNKLRLLNDFDSPIPGVRIRLTPGHSPGHAVFEFKKGKSRLTVVGDLWHLRELQVRNTRIGLTFDTNSTLAGVSRRKMMRIFTWRRDLILAFHENFPGLGYVRRKNKFSFDWVFASLNELQPGRVETCSNPN